MDKSYDELLEKIQQLTEKNEQLKKEYDKLGEMYDDLSLSYEDALLMYDQAKEKIRMESELQVASNIQMSMIPKKFPEHPGFDMYATITPAKEVGGDLYGYYLQDDKLYFCVGDVSGKGVPASLFMAQATRLFRILATMNMMPAEICNHINDALTDGNSALMFVTFFIGLIDMKTGQLDFCNCGHCAPVISDGEGHADFVKVLPNRPIGIFPKIRFKGEKIDNIKGKYLFIYTDGLDEAENLQFELFGKDRMLEVLRDKTSDKATQAIETMTAEIEKHRNGAEPSDDLTMMYIKIKD